MTNQVSRALVEDFYRAYVSRDPERIAAFLDDDVEWHVAGPSEIMQVCGYWRGKAAVTDRFRRLISGVVEYKEFNRECLLVDGDRSAVLGQVKSRHLQSGRTISHRFAHFACYRDGKVAHFRVINDSFDAVEQYLGHPLAVHDDCPPLADGMIAV